MLNALNIKAAQVCFLASKTKTKAGKCQWSCISIRNKNWANGRLPGYTRVNTNVKKIIASYSGQAQGGHFLKGFRPGTNGFQENMKNVRWSCGSYKGVYSWG